MSDYLINDARIETRRVLECFMPGDIVRISWESLDSLFDFSLHAAEELERELGAKLDEVEELESELGAKLDEVEELESEREDLLKEIDELENKLGDRDS